MLDLVIFQLPEFMKLWLHYRISLSSFGAFLCLQQSSYTYKVRRTYGWPLRVSDPGREVQFIQHRGSEALLKLPHGAKERGRPVHPGPEGTHYLWEGMNISDRDMTTETFDSIRKTVFCRHQKFVPSPLSDSDSSVSQGCFGAG